MADLRLVLEIEQVCEGLLLGQHGEGERRDELGAAFGQNDAHGCAPLFQAADELQRLVGGDAAADDQKDALALHVFVSLRVIPTKPARSRHDLSNNGL